MKHIDPVKFREALNKFKAEIKPSEKDIKASSLLATYWSAIDVVLHVVDTAVMAATVEEIHQKTETDKPDKTTNHWF